MNPDGARVLAAKLKSGEYRDAQPQLISQAAQSLADEIGAAASQVPKGDFRNAVRALNAHRHFEETKIVAQAWCARYGCDAGIHKHMAQALIELDAFDAAAKALDEAVALAKSSPANADFLAEASEYAGLRGRILKQLFIRDGDRNQLRAAADTYIEEYERGGKFWHGVNALALQVREWTEGLPARPGADLAQLARTVLQSALDGQRRDGDHWSLATASEACLALAVLEPDGSWCDQAELWLYRFLEHPDTGPFALEGYFRQLREVWRGNAMNTQTCADRLAAIAQRHVMRTQRRWNVAPRQINELVQHESALEKNFSGERAFTVRDLRTMLGLCPNVGCVIDPTGVRLGTGFLLAGSEFGLDAELVFVTNAHVISDSVPGALHPADARVIFEVESAAARSPRVHEIADVLFSSPPGELGEILPELEALDTAIVTLKTVPEDVVPLRIASSIPLPAPTTKAFVVGHPQAGALQFSLQDSELLDVCPNERLMHYRTPTDPGSSGSPVFNAKWELVALHHAGSQRCRRLHGTGEYQANEGIILRAVQRAVVRASK